MSEAPRAKTAFDAPRINAYSIEPEKLVLITDKKHPLYDPRVEWPVKEELVISMMAVGYKGPAIQAFKDGDKAVVLDGRQRTKAAVEANKRLRALKCEPLCVKVLFERGEEKSLFGIQLLANENRTDDSDLERARKLQRSIDFGQSEEQAGLVLGLKPSRVKQLLSLLDLSPEVKTAVESGNLSTSAAAKLAKLPREEQKEALEEASKEVTAPKRGEKSRVRVSQVNKAIKKKKGACGCVSGDPPSKKEVAAMLISARAEWDKGGKPADTTEFGTVIDALEWVLEGKKPKLGAMARLLGTEEK
jgi:ParB family chromosome partitioning protein